VALVINKHNAAARLGKAVSDGATCTSESLAPQMKRPVLFASLQTFNDLPAVDSNGIRFVQRLRLLLLRNPPPPPYA